MRYRVEVSGPWFDGDGGFRPVFPLDAGRRNAEASTFDSHEKAFAEAERTIVCQHSDTIWRVAEVPDSSPDDFEVIRRYERQELVKHMMRSDDYYWVRGWGTVSKRLAESDVEEIKGKPSQMQFCPREF
jgi:hypothetical protein